MFDFEEEQGEFNPWLLWRNMPEYVQEDLKPHQSIIVHFDKEEDVKEFSKLVNQKITNRTKFIWFPLKEREERSKFRYVQEEKINNES